MCPAGLARSGPPAFRLTPFYTSCSFIRFHMFRFLQTVELVDQPFFFLRPVTLLCLLDSQIENSMYRLSLRVILSSTSHSLILLDDSALAIVKSIMDPVSLFLKVRFPLIAAMVSLSVVNLSRSLISRDSLTINCLISALSMSWWCLDDLYVSL